MALIAFTGNHIISLLVNDLLDNCRLTADRINCHNTSLDVQDVQQERDSRNFIGLIRCAQLSQYQCVGCCPSTDHMQWCQINWSIACTTGGFAINRDDFCGKLVAEVGDPGKKTALKRVRVKSRKD